MDIRQFNEDRERQFLAPWACLSSATVGRVRPEPPCTIRTAFQHDRDRILNSKAFRRLKYKTQVFLSPEGDHYRTRLTHTLEVAQIARTVARALALNEDLTEAIALGHDLGHTPFGHAGERVLDALSPGGFRHVHQSGRVVRFLEDDGRGLNLTGEVLDGILKHSKGKGPLLDGGPETLAITLEGRVVRLADIIAYVNHDLDDAVRAGLIRASEVPAGITGVLGGDAVQRIDTMIRDLVEASLATDGADIRLNEAVATAIVDLRNWLFVHVYRVPSVHDDFEKASRILRELFHYFLARPAALEQHGGRCLPGDPREVSVADFIAGMTDRYAMNLYQRLFLPQPWKIF
jgi:dGTPase